jgi:CubicO group peptidase (beta-lactamase class C family)
LLNEFEIVGKRTITVRDLLTHTSHFPAWKPLYLFISDKTDALSGIAATELEFGEDGVIYSDLNFIVLGKLIERITEKRLDQLAVEEIFKPLGLRRTCFNPPMEWKRQIAASEFGNVYEKQTCIERGDLDPVDAGKHFRDYQIWGEVHDGNAWFVGGAAGHAGLFSTVEEVAKIAWQFLPAHSSLLKSSTCDLFRTNFTAKTNEDRSFAFQLASTPGSTAGELMSRESFGHTGFTGTSLWIDPLRERVFILLTNRTHHHDLPFVNINAVRRRFHDLGNEHFDRNF